MGRYVLITVWCLLAAACSGSGSAGSAPRQDTAAKTAPVPAATQPAQRPPAVTRVAVVTTELRNQVAVVALPSGRLVRRIAVAADPKTAAAEPDQGGPVAIVSPGSGTVTLLGQSLRRIAVFRGFRSPQLAAFTPDGEYALVTDAVAGTLSVIDLSARAVVGRVRVGAAAHHLAVSRDGRRVWVALGETASTIVVVDLGDTHHPRVLRRIYPAVATHDLAFSPDGHTVWVSSATAPYVSVLHASDGRLVARVPAGRAPQHVLFADGHAYVTSGYGDSVEMVDPHTRSVLRRARTPYGSFNLAAAGSRLVLTSVLDGEVSVLSARTLRRLHETRVATVARSVAVLVR